MAPLPDNSTARLFLDYTSRHVEHTLLLRFDGDLPSAGSYATGYAEILANRMFDDDSFFRARFSDAGADFSLPIAFTAVPGAIPAATTNSWAQDPESAFVSFVMRGLTTGRRSRVEFFTGVPTPSWPSDNRYNPGDAAPIDTLRINFQNAAASGGTLPLITVGGDEVTVYGYVNIALNAYWQRKQRA